MAKPSQSSFLAKCSLEAYLQAEEQFDPEFVWKQMKGIASGLAFLHGLREDEPNKIKKEEYATIAYHLDLKPENILIVNDVFQITDFGLAKVRSQISVKRYESDSDGTGNEGGYSTYAPPEHATMTRKASSGYDLWSLGAIFSEMATHDINAQGTPNASVSNYRKDLSFEERVISSRRFHKDGMMKDAIASQHQDLFTALHDRAFRHQNTFISPWQVHFYTANFFGLIHKMLDPIATARGTAKDVVVNLDQLFTDTESQLSSGTNLKMKNIPVSVSHDIFKEAENHEVQKIYDIPNDAHYM